MSRLSTNKQSILLDQPFEVAMRMLRTEKCFCIAREHWLDPHTSSGQHYLTYENDKHSQDIPHFIMYYPGPIRTIPGWTPNTVDLMAEDWMVIKDRAVLNRIPDD